MFALLNPLSSEYFDSSAASTFGITFLYDKMLASRSNFDTGSLFKVAIAYLSSPIWPKGQCLFWPIYSATYSYFQTLRGLFCAVQSFNVFMFVEDGLGGVLAFVIQLPRTMTTIELTIFLNNT